MLFVEGRAPPGRRLAIGEATDGVAPPSPSLGQAGEVPSIAADAAFGRELHQRPAGGDEELFHVVLESRESEHVVERVGARRVGLERDDQRGAGVAVADSRDRNPLVVASEDPRRVLHVRHIGSVTPGL